MKVLNKNIAMIVSGLLLTVGIIAGTSVTANGQWGSNRNWDGYPNWGGTYELRQTALNEGYNEGTKAGQNDGSRGQRNLNDYSAYRNATKGYNSRMGDRELYRRYFQLAFQNGYNTVLGIQNGGGYNNYGNYNNNYGNYNNGYGNNRDRDPYWNGNNNRTRRGRNWTVYGNYGGSYQLRQTALNAGYNDGNSQGAKDRNRGRQFDPFSQGNYRNANKDYNSRYGDFGLYQRYYREGYENGYSDAYYYGYQQ